MTICRASSGKGAGSADDIGWTPPVAAARLIDPQPHPVVKRHLEGDWEARHH
jgi:hypothetical protein